MKRLKLKSWVVPALYIVSISIIFISVVIVGRIMATDYEKAVNNNTLVPEENDSFTGEDYYDDGTHSVVDVTNETVNRPYMVESVTVAKDYYDKKSSEEDRTKSLIFYKNTYMKNTGVLYKADEQFDVVAVLDGNVTSVTKDEILGNVVEVTHSTELVTIYHCLGEVSVKAGDVIKQNDVIGKSGSVNIDEGYQNALLFEVNYRGNIINPNEFYEMKVKDLLG